MERYQDQQLIIPALGKLYRSLHDLAEVLLRIVVGVNLIPHGIPKLGNLGGIAQWLASEGYTPGMLWAVAIASVETIGGVLLVLGLLVRPVALAVALFMVVAVTHHWEYGFLWGDGGWEYPFMWAVAAFYFVVRGGGRWSLDRRIGKEF